MERDWNVVYCDKKINLNSLDFDVELVSQGKRLNLHSGGFYSSLKYKMNHEVTTDELEGSNDLLSASLQVRVYNSLNNERIPYRKPVIGGVTEGYLQKVVDLSNGLYMGEFGKRTRFSGKLKFQFKTTTFSNRKTEFCFELKYSRVSSFNTPILILVSKPFSVNSRPTGKRKRESQDTCAFLDGIREPSKKKRKLEVKIEKPLVIRKEDNVGKYKEEFDKLLSIVSRLKIGSVKNEVTFKAFNSLLCSPFHLTGSNSGGSCDVEFDFSTNSELNFEKQLPLEILDEKEILDDLDEKNFRSYDEDDCTTQCSSGDLFNTDELLSFFTDDKICPVDEYDKSMEKSYCSDSSFLDLNDAFFPLGESLESLKI